MAKSREARSDLELLKDGLQEAYDATEVWSDGGIGLELAYLAYDVLCVKPSKTRTEGWVQSQFSGLVKRSCPSLKKLLKRRGYKLT
jgi:hypothetical protein